MSTSDLQEIADLLCCEPTKASIIKCLEFNDFIPVAWQYKVAGTWVTSDTYPEVDEDIEIRPLYVAGGENA